MIAACELPESSPWDRIQQAVARELLSQAQRRYGRREMCEAPPAAKAMRA